LIFNLKSVRYWCDFDFAAKESELEKLQTASESNEFWNNPEEAQKVMKRLSTLQADIADWRQLKLLVDDTLELARLEGDSLRSEIEQEISEIEKEINRREFAAMLSGKFDRGNAILAIHAGAGGVDAQDWAQMLERMYLRWAEIRGYETEVIDTSEGEEAGIKSATISVKGKYAFGYLRSEKGVHRLVRLSPFDAAHRRHTSFALVEILPELEDDSEIEIKSDEIKIDVYRSSGAGGQNVQKNATAIRITHLPTGLVVTCQNERSQTQNRENALRVLRARLFELKQIEQDQQMADMRGEYTKAEWGSQIRSYVLHPYQMVKDHRTNFEVGNAQGVLNGSIDSFIEAYLRAKITGDLVNGSATEQ
jgi:peptide chain release factor 2